MPNTGSTQTSDDKQSSSATNTGSSTSGSSSGVAPSSPKSQQPALVRAQTLSPTLTQRPITSPPPAPPIAPPVAPTDGKQEQKQSSQTEFQKFATWQPDAKDPGNTILASLRTNRAAGVNDGSSHRHSNCAAVTMAALLAGKNKSSAIVGKWAQQYKLDSFSAQHQNEKFWATVIAQALLSKADQSSPLYSMKTLSPDLVKTLVEFIDYLPVGNAWVIGDAQYVGMRTLLLNEADARTQGSNSKPAWCAVECGEPGNRMFTISQLLAYMVQLPNGTQFAVFLNAPTSKGVQQHWLYAEKYNDSLVFIDYQTNTSVVESRNSPVQVGIGKVPAVPLDPLAVFEFGSFLALVPQAPNAFKATSTCKLLDRSVVKNDLLSVEQKFQELAPKANPMTADKLPVTWRMEEKKEQAVSFEIPNPAMVQAKIVQLASQFGVEARCWLDIPGEATPSLTSKNAIQIFTMQADSKTGIVSAPSLNSVTKIYTPAKPNATSQVDAKLLPEPGAGTSAVTQEWSNLYSNVFEIGAQAGGDGIKINAEKVAFADIIHESIHVFQKATGARHLEEGMAELYAAIITEQIRQEFSDQRFVYNFNVAYSPFTYFAIKLVELIGLNFLIEWGFDYIETHAHPHSIDRNGKQGHVVLANCLARKENAKDIWEVIAHPRLYMNSLDMIAAAIQGPPVVVDANLDKIYQTVVASFRSQMLALKKQALMNDELWYMEAGQKVDLSFSADEYRVACRLCDQVLAQTAEQVLPLLARQMSEADGLSYRQVRSKKELLENSIRTYCSNLARLNLRVTGVPNGKSIWVVGTLTELGGTDPTAQGAAARAVKLTGLSDGVWQNVFQIADGFTKQFRYAFFSQDDKTQARTLLGRNQSRAGELPFIRMQRYGGSYTDLAAS